MPRPIARVVLGAAVAAVGAIVVAARPAPAQGEDQGQVQGVFSVSTQGVLVDVLVTDCGRVVAGLTAADFEVRDNGVVQQVDALRVADLPVSAVLALDTSSSTAGQRLQDLKTASTALLDGLHGNDRVALTTFGQAVSMVAPLTADVASVRQAINRLSPHGDTALFDGTYAALVSTLQETGRSLVVVCTDGRDTTSWLEPDEVLESARRTNAVVYIVATGGARRWGVLKDLADATGGQLMELASSADLRPQFQKILDEFRSRYVLTYTPLGVTRDGFHRLDVRVRRGGLTVKARPGYIGGMK